VNTTPRRAQQNLSGEQFKRVEYPDSTLYAAQDALGGDPNAGVWRDLPTAEVRVSKPNDTYMYNKDLYNGQQMDHWSGDRSRGYASAGPLEPERHGQYAMLENSHDAPKVDWMVGHNDVKHHIPMLMGVAANDALARYHEPLHASDDLSKHSAPIVDRLAERGVVAPRDKSLPLNSISAADPEYNQYVNADFVDRPNITPDERMLGRATIRSVLRHKPAQAMHGAQFEQHRLF
jgi:hypothetical protein